FVTLKGLCGGGCVLGKAFGVLAGCLGSARALACWRWRLRHRELTSFRCGFRRADHIRVFGEGAEHNTRGRVCSPDADLGVRDRRYKQEIVLEMNAAFQYDRGLWI